MQNECPILLPTNEAVTLISDRTYLEVQDESPDESQDQLGVAVHYLIVPDIHQLDLRGKWQAMIT